MEEPGFIFARMMSLCAPTIRDSLMDCDVMLGGRPVLFYDPTTINELMKFFKNLEDQDAKEVFQCIFDAFKEQKEKKKKREQMKWRKFDPVRKDAGALGIGHGKAAHADANFKTPEWTNQAVRVQPEQEGAGSRIQRDLSDDSSESEHNRKEEAAGYQCDKVQPININLNIDTAEGLSIICLHHRERTSPFVQFLFERFHYNYAMYYDHDIMRGEFDVAAVSDLTMWPQSDGSHW